MSTSLREQVASLEETHVFSPHAAQHGARRLFARRLFLHGRADARNSRRQPARLSGRRSRSARSWWAAARRRIPTAQLSLAGSNNGSNLHVARNLFTYEDRVSFTKGRHQFSVGRVVPAAAVERNAGAQPVRAGDLHQPADLSARHRRRRCFTIRRRRRSDWRSLVRRLVMSQDAIRLTSQPDGVARLPRRVHHRLE